MRGGVKDRNPGETGSAGAQHKVTPDPHTSAPQDLAAVYGSKPTPRLIELHYNGSFLWGVI